MAVTTRDLGEELAEHVRELVSRSSSLTRRSAILVDSSRHNRARETLVPECAWCGKVRVGGLWALPDELPGFLTALRAGRRTHGICPSCLADLQGTAASVPLPRTAVLIHAAGARAAECLMRALQDYEPRERPGFVVEALLPDPTGPAVSTLVSAVSACLAANALGPVTLQLAEETYLLDAG